ncbi:ABC transporter permease [Bacillus atrophaeus]|uniref:ABC transporter permease n=1 Tax=Bacillus atrophaeus TaxID=1452 RepID=UPI002E20FD18|nr:FtsX-like permease family protein [Bacillus atrophaeus]MED1031435.1 FtsX-like permease family protein [Bacillus atrophaeus]MED1120267.1 FtsX-like permease family protein [Bacillus atrophaeus]MED1130013.1 FtsX-like permease family protein [Bacillus atrophaeus]
MIRSYKQLSQKYLRSNVKRTVLTLLGIILALSLITTIGLFFNSGYTSQIEKAKKGPLGSANISVENYNQKLLNTVKSNPNIASYGIASQGETLHVDGIDISYMYANHQALKMLKSSIPVQGKLPSTEKEAVLEGWMLSYIGPNLKLGDMFTMHEKEYKLVGLLHDSNSMQENKNGRLLTYKNEFKAGEGNLLIELEQSANFNEVENQFTLLTNKENIKMNEELNKALKPSSEIIVAATISIGIVVISTIVIIYNAFQISVVERMKQLGLLRSIGATQKQIRKIVMREATFLSIIAIFFGILCSIFVVLSLNQIMLKVLNNPAGSTIQLDWRIIFISSFITLITVYVSSFFPAFRAGRISPLLAISSRLSIKKDKIKKQKGKKIKKPISFPLSMALKNIKRNPNRYTVTILSIIISSVLYITYTFLIDTYIQHKQPTDQALKADISVMINSDLDKLSINRMSQNLQQINNVEKLYKQYEAYNFHTKIPENKQIKELQGNSSLYEKVKYNDRTLEIMKTHVKAYDENTLKELAESVTSGRIDLEKINREKGVILVKQAASKDMNTGKTYVGLLGTFKVGDTIQVIQDQQERQSTEKVSYTQDKIETLKIAAIVESDIFNMSRTLDTITFITSEQVVDSITKSFPTLKGIGIELKNQSQAKTTILNIQKKLGGDESIQVINNMDENNTIQDQMLYMKILAYGFIVVITLIGSVNILNTITVSIMMRRKELAALKSIGMSQKDLKKMVIYEGLLYGFFGSIQGIFFGCLLSYILYVAVSNTISFEWVIPYQASFITFITALLISYVAVLIPLRKIQKDNTIDVLREG